MALDPMVSALQGPPDPTMDALMSPLPPTVTVPFLQDWQLKEKGHEMLKDPNRPQYDPTNTFKPIIPGREHIPTNLGPQQPWGTMVQSGQDPVAPVEFWPGAAR